jgi:hypothetical protein
MSERGINTMTAGTAGRHNSDALNASLESHAEHRKAMDKPVNGMPYS